MERKELTRQSIHIIAGLAFMMILIYFGRITLIGTSILLLFFGSLLINFKLTGKHIPIAHDIGDAIERKEVRFPGWGAAWYVFGVIALATLLVDNNEIISGIFILAVSDGLATIVGMHGKHKIPYNNKKTIEGSVVFFVSALAAYLFVGPKIVLLAAITTLIESANLPIDDNFSLPMVCTIYLFLF